MNILPINAEWKRRIKWSEQQRKQQTTKKPSNQAKYIKPVGDEATRIYVGSGRNER